MDCLWVRGTRCRTPHPYSLGCLWTAYGYMVIGVGHHIPIVWAAYGYMVIGVGHHIPIVWAAYGYMVIGVGHTSLQFGLPMDT